MSRTPASPRAHLLLVGALTTGLFMPLAGAAPAAAVTTAGQHQLVPAYFYPVDGPNPWAQLCASPAGSTVIANPNSGPGDSFLPEYAEVIDDCRASGHDVIGYVGTDYTERPLAQVKAEIDRYSDFYGVEGIFLDEMSSEGDPATKAYYAELRDYIKDKGADRTVVVNPGWADATTAWHAEVADIVVAFENTAAAYHRWTAPEWTLRAPAGKIGHLVHTTSGAEAARVHELSVQRNAGNVYVTDDVMTNPWDTLSSYWAPGSTPAAPEKPTYTAPITSPFRDVRTDHLFYEEIAWLASEGISTGWDAGQGVKTFRPDARVNRDAMAAFLYRQAGSPEFIAPAVSPFQDVRTDHLFYKEIAWLASEGISTGWGEGKGVRTFRPDAPVTRGAMAAFLYRQAGSPEYTTPAVSPFQDVATTQQFAKEMLWLASEGISTGWDEGGNTRTFRAFTPVTRDAMAAFLYRLAPML
ncbi:spherulation-specific family 4 protein [Kocuria sp. SM24M-10]|uniref:spherulation-specific family 4 protein n=1 Tax=Kocuria sp. SM24M-10 TaxID=1660349 RepID=UPI00069AFAB3